MAIAVGTRGRVLVDQLRGWVEPAAALRALAGRGAFLLEAGAGGRWSYLAPRAAAVLELRAEDDFAAAARLALRELAADAPDGAPPFTGGLAGSFGYDLARGLERLPRLARDHLRLPAARLHAVETVAAFDHERREVLVCGRSRGEVRALGDALGRVREQSLPEPPGGALEAMPFTAYRPLVERILGHIERGDVYQVNLTHRTEAACRGALDLYARLRAGAPGAVRPLPRGGRLGAGRRLARALPRRDADGRVETRPIKGTRPRADDAGRGRGARRRRSPQRRRTAPRT